VWSGVAPVSRTSAPFSIVHVTRRPSLSAFAIKQAVLETALVPVPVHDLMTRRLGDSKDYGRMATCALTCAPASTLSNHRLSLQRVTYLYAVAGISEEDHHFFARRHLASPLVPRLEVDGCFRHARALSLGPV
jgi:hypothetical protein